MTITDLQRVEMLRRFHGGASFRAIARALRIDRKTVADVIHTYERTRETPHSALPRVRVRRSQLDAHADHIAAVLERYPDITAVRLDEELRAKGFTGGHTIVKDRLRALRPQPTREPVVRFETGMGVHYGKTGVMLSKGSIPHRSLEWSPAWATPAFP